MLLKFRNVLLPGLIILCTFVNARSQNDAEQDETVSAHFQEGDNLLEDPEIDYNPQNIDEMNLHPGNEELGNLFSPEDNWFEQVNFKGAFGQTNWLNQWSILDRRGYLK